MKAFSNKGVSQVGNRSRGQERSMKRDRKEVDNYQAIRKNIFEELKDMDFNIKLTHRTVVYCINM